MNSHGRRLFAGCWIVLALAGAAAAQGRPAPLSFTVSTPEPASHLFHVRLRCDGLTGDTVEFRMPAWLFGFYGLFDFAGNVRNFSAVDDDGHPLPSAEERAQRLDGAHGWSSQLSPDLRRPRAENPFVANAFLDETRGYITPGALFVYVPGPVAGAPGDGDLIDLNREVEHGVATGLDPVPGEGRPTRSPPPTSTSSTTARS